MEPFVFKNEIELEFGDLNEFVLHTILCKMKERFENTCFKEYGYIKKIDSIVNVVDNYSSRTTNKEIFIVKAKGERLLPKINMLLNAKIEKVLKIGIYLILESLRILIPLKNLKDCNIEGSNIVFPSGSRKQVGDFIDIRILEIKYENKKFMAIGEIVV